MRLIVTGSIAYDYVMVFPGQFQDHILPDKMHVLSVSFLVDSMKRLYGGTAANIAYNLALVGERPELVGAVGQDFAAYQAWLDSRGVATGAVKVIGDDFTSSCFINTDLKHNQITAFYPGAMKHAASIRLADLAPTASDLVLIAPNAPDAMAAYARECTELGVPYLYDPSMQAPRMTADELEAGFAGAKILTGNDYEFGMMAEKLGCTEAELRRRVPITLMTGGEAGALITVDGEEHAIPAAKPTVVIDPTGAGDAYRAGFVLGMARGFSWPVVGRLGALTAVYAIEQVGTQNHDYTIEEFVARYRENFGPSAEVDTLLAPATVA